MFSFTTGVKRVFFLICLCLTLISFPSPSYALTVRDVPNPRVSYGGWVTDMAQILKPNTEVQLNKIISKLEREKGDEIAIVTVPETTPSPTPKAFTTKLFDYWGIGKKEQNNGVLFLVSVGDRRVEIETGYGIRDILSNADVSNIIQQEIIPQFRQGNFENGILTGTKSLVSRLSKHQQVALQSTTDSYAELLLFIKKNENLLALILLVVILWLLWNFNAKVDSQKKSSSGSDTTSTYSDPSFSSGGSDFGGGSSGGDGSW